MKIIICILTIFISTVFSCYSQTQLKTDEIVKNIADNNYVSYAPDGFFAVDSSKQFILYTDLLKTATSEELIKLTKHKKPAVRVYAIWCLNEKKDTNLYSVIVNHIHDNQTVKTYFADMTRERMVGDFFVSVNNITKSERESLDSILLNNDNKLWYTNSILKEIDPIDKNYERIRTLAKKREFAVIALAKYQKEEDIQFIKKQLLKEHYFSIKSIELFPSNEFKSTLTELRKQGYNLYGTYFSVAVYQDSFSINYFNSKLDELSNNDFKRKQEGEYIFEAIFKYRNPIYDSLLFRLWESDYIIDDTTFAYLLTVDSIKCKKLAIKSINNANELDNSTLVLVDLLNFIIYTDKSIATSLISENILTISVHEFIYFSEASQKIKEQRIIQSLFTRLEKSDNGHIFVPITETILSYNDPKLNKKLIMIIKDNPRIDGWGLDKVKKMINEKGLKL